MKKQQIIKTLIEQKILNDTTTVIGIMDYDRIKVTVTDLYAAFPSNFQHTFAVKANALVDVLIQLKTHGMGAEVASPGELEIALKAGYQAENIIFDSPAKTTKDLITCIEHNISLNIDNLQELDRLDEIIKKYPETKSVIGFRVNPQIGSGGISSTSTATSTSKFGYALADDTNMEDLIKLYLDRPWLTSIHTHSGSQGCPLELMSSGIKIITELAETINEKAGKQQIKRLDIGGGLPVNFHSEEITPTFTEYANLLKKDVPLLFSGKYQVKTEFGRSIVSKNGFMVTRVEYTKFTGGRYIATTHAGVQIATRTIFLPESWPIRVTGFTNTGDIRNEGNSPLVSTDVAGPCCFAGDLICKNRELPKLEVNDYVMIHDTGGYYFSNHFDYNSLARISIYSAKYDNQDNQTIKINSIREGQALSDVVKSMM